VNPPVALTSNQSGTFEHLYVLCHGRLRDAVGLTEFADCGRSGAEAGNHPAASGVRQRRKHGVHMGF
jgi:hypothetical protein